MPEQMILFSMIYVRLQNKNGEIMTQVIFIV